MHCHHYYYCIPSRYRAQASWRIPKCCWYHLSNKTLELCCFETDNQNDSGLSPESSFQWNTGINCFVLHSTKQFTYRMILVFHWTDDSAKRPESYWLSVSKQHNSNVLMERWYQQHLGILQFAWALRGTWRCVRQINDEKL